jgi:hypothetical protein
MGSPGEKRALGFDETLDTLRRSIEARCARLAISGKDSSAHGSKSKGGMRLTGRLERLQARVEALPHERIGPHGDRGRREQERKENPRGRGLAADGEPRATHPSESRSAMVRPCPLERKNREVFHEGSDAGNGVTCGSELGAARVRERETEVESPREFRERSFELFGRGPGSGKQLLPDRSEGRKARPIGGREPEPGQGEEQAEQQKARDKGEVDLEIEPAHQLPARG